VGRRARHQREILGWINDLLLLNLAKILGRRHGAPLGIGPGEDACERVAGSQVLRCNAFFIVRTPVAAGELFLLYYI
jgi:hypothetical protein